MAQPQLTNTLAAALAVANKDLDKQSGPRALIDELAGAMARPTQYPAAQRSALALSASPDGAAYDDGSDDDFDLPMLMQGPKALTFASRPEFEPRREGKAALYGFGAGLAILIPIGIMMGAKAVDPPAPAVALERAGPDVVLRRDALASATGAATRARASALAEAAPLQTVEPAGLPQTASSMAIVLRDAANLIALGDIGAARTLLGGPVAADDPAALLALAETYDPNMLAAWNALDVRPNVDIARNLYARAILGDQPKARKRLDALE